MGLLHHIKIGKTTRTPEDRAVEISDSTGVPVPFVVLYKERVEDCDRAEMLIHQRLDGNRVSSNREFFELEASEAVRVVREVVEELEANE